MFIKRVDLENIRSYRKGSVQFKKGTTLLTGDVGCGKTTILIALEYALFGILRGKTSPAELLRHDAKKGSVTVVLEIQGKEVTITRALKRSGKNILQDAGTILIDGTHEDLVATELKARILNLLGYPDSLLSKSTNLFRYTVYTPQEQVKLILHESVEERKDIIRKIFDIDKFKRVGENIAYYLTDSRERIQRLKGQTDDLKVLKEQLASQEKELALIAANMPEAEKVVDEFRKKREKIERSLEYLQKEQENLRNQEQACRLIEKDYVSMQEHLRLVSIQIKQLQAKEEIKIERIEPISQEKKAKLKELFSRLQEKRDILSKREGEQFAEKTRAQKLSSSIADLSNCPVCKQDVSADHKKNIVSQQKAILEDIAKKELQYKELRKKLQEKELELKKKEEELLEQEKKFARYQEKEKQRTQQTQELLRLQEQEKVYQEKTDLLKKTLLDAKADFAKLKKDAIDDMPLKEELAQIRKDERKKELALQELKTKEHVAKNMQKTLVDAITQKEKIQEKIEILSSLRHWVAELFVPLVKTIERKVLLKVYKEFNEFFIKWFGMLVQDDALLVRLDEEFTPRIEQNGFDTSLANLSGGEKTSLALAYRLALNKVLNDYFSSLYTKGLLILDEPTDGFSSEQVDTLRDVLDQAGVQQLIIVSHEQRLESLADHLLRVSKTNQESSVSLN